MPYISWALHDFHYSNIASLTVITITNILIITIIIIIANIINIVSNCQHCLILRMYWVKSWYLLQSFPKSGKICVMLWARATCPPMSAQFVPTPNLLGKRPELKIVFVFVFMFQAVHFGHCDNLHGKRPELKINPLSWHTLVCEESSYKVIYVRNHVTLGNWPGSSWWSLQEYDICCPSNCPKCPRAHLGSSQRGGCLQI